MTSKFSLFLFHAVITRDDRSGRNDPLMKQLVHVFVPRLVKAVTRNIGRIKLQTRSGRVFGVANDIEIMKAGLISK